MSDRDRDTAEFAADAINPLAVLGEHMLLHASIAETCPFPVLVSRPEPVPGEPWQNYRIFYATEAAISLFKGNPVGHTAERLIPPERIEEHRKGSARLAAAGNGDIGSQYIGDLREWEALTMEEPPQRIPVRQRVVRYVVGEDRFYYLAWYY